VLAGWCPLTRYLAQHRRNGCEVNGYRRPAAYIRVARGCPPDAVTTQERAVCQAARRHGWPEPAIYVDIGASDADDEHCTCGGLSCTVGLRAEFEWLTT
jgi:hypothetical protein